MVINHVNVVFGAVVGQHAVAGKVGAEPAFPETGKQFPPGEGDDAGKKSVPLSVGKQVAAAVQVTDGVEHIALR